MFDKLKSLILDDTVYMAVLLVLVSIASFGLGRLSVTIPDNQSAVVVNCLISQARTLEMATVATATSAQIVSAVSTLEAPVPAIQNYVASKSGTKYHKLSCPGAKQIKDTNKIYFATENEAEAAGYTKAANCKF